MVCPDGPNLPRPYFCDAESFNNGLCWFEYLSLLPSTYSFSVTFITLYTIAVTVISIPPPPSPPPQPQPQPNYTWAQIT
jgi:hypothetical protein